MAGSKFDGSMIDSVQERIENGMVFEASYKQLAANAGGKVEWVFKTGNKPCVVFAREINTNGDEITYQAFKEPAVTVVGTPATQASRNAKDNLGGSAKLYGASAFTGGTPLPAVYMPGAQGQGNRTIGQFSKEGFVRVLEANTTYGARITNGGTKTSASVELYLMWAEVTDNKPFR